MTQFFVQVFNRENKCAHCKESKLFGYSLCRVHLAMARERFRNWATERREKGLCIRCHRKGWKGGSRLNSRGHRIAGGVRLLRCRLHTMENREKCARWIAAHPEHSANQWAIRKQMMAEGKCPSCPEHRTLPAGFKRCDECRARRRGREQKLAA